MAKFLYSYPNFDFYSYIHPKADTAKWVESIKKIYSMMHQGMDKNEALNKITSGWEKMEKRDFQNWLKFYEEGAQNKYKTAQNTYWTSSERPGYVIPMFPDPSKKSTQDLNAAREQERQQEQQNQEAQEKQRAEEKREIIEAQRQKIVSRLDSTEKLLRSREGQLFAGNELEALLDVIYSLKKKIHTVNKISTSNRIYNDLIAQGANKLLSYGFNKASGVLLKLADNPDPAPPEPANPLNGGGLPGNIPGEGPGMDAPPRAPMLEDFSGEISEGMKQFLEGMEKGNSSFDDELEDLEVNDSEDEKEPNYNIEVFDDLVAQAQLADVEPEKRSFSKEIDRVLQTCTIEDAIVEFEFISNFFKAREIPRRLAKADMMLDSLSLSPFFPTLGEATNKALDANNYISTRIEEILSKLKGSVKSQTVELESNMGTLDNPATTTIKQNLQNEESKEKTKREVRKELANQELANQNRPVPNVELNELAAPAKLAPPPKANPLV